MDKRVSANEARRDFRDLLDLVDRRDMHLTITRYGKPAAVIVPVDWYAQAKELIGGWRPRQQPDDREG